VNFKKLSAGFLVVLLIVVAAPKSASAATIGFTCLTNNTGSCSSFDQFFTGTVTVSGTQMTATINNTGSGGVIGQIYVDFTDPVTGYAFNSITGGPGTTFSLGSGNLPSANAADPDFDSDFAFEAAPPPTTNGVNNGEFFSVVFDLLSGQSQATIDALILSGDIRFGLHVQSLGTNNLSEALISSGSCVDCTPTQQSTVPEPTSMLLLGTGLLAAARARRKKTTL
jgi:PEP-CTERM motif